MRGFGSWALLAFASFAIGCMEEDAPASAPEGPALGTLRTRDADLRMEPTGQGLRFSVYLRNGGGAQHDLSEAELSSRYHELYRVYRSAQAKTYLDARLDRAPPVSGVTEGRGVGRAP